MIFGANVVFTVGEVPNQTRLSASWLVCQVNVVVPLGVVEVALTLLIIGATGKVVVPVVTSTEVVAVAVRPEVSMTVNDIS